jgi:hypothetical protein
LGGWDQEASRPAQANSARDPVSKISRAKVNWRYGSSSRAFAWQAWSWVQTLIPYKKKIN